MGFLDSSVVKNLPDNGRDTGDKFDSWFRKNHSRRKWSAFLPG